MEMLVPFTEMHAACKKGSMDCMVTSAPTLAHAGFIALAMMGSAASALCVIMRSCGRGLMCIPPISDHRREPSISDK
jgi:hypothetical protein